MSRFLRWYLRSTVGWLWERVNDAGLALLDLADRVQSAGNRLCDAAEHRAPSIVAVERALEDSAAAANYAGARTPTVATGPLRERRNGHHNGAHP